RNPRLSYAPCSSECQKSSSAFGTGLQSGVSTAPVRTSLCPVELDSRKFFLCGESVLKKGPSVCRGVITPQVCASPCKGSSSAAPSICLRFLLIRCISSFHAQHLLEGVHHFDQVGLVR